MTDMLLSIDVTMKALIAIARARGTSMCGIWPLVVEVDIVKGLPVWILDGGEVSEQQVRAAWEKARAARAVPNIERRPHVRAE